jgi:hypothetical protein
MALVVDAHHALAAIWPRHRIDYFPDALRWIDDMRDAALFCADRSIRDPPTPGIQDTGRVVSERSAYKNFKHKKSPA